MVLRPEMSDVKTWVWHKADFHGKINDAYDLGCELQRKRIECAIMIKAALAEIEEGEVGNEKE